MPQKRRESGKTSFKKEYRPAPRSKQSRERKEEGVRERPPSDLEGALVGRHPVLEAMRSGRAVTRLWVQEGLREGSLREIVALARQQHVPVSEVPRSFLDRLADGVPHQGIGAQAGIKPTLDISQMTELLKAVPEPIIFFLDGLQDPHNLGAVLRAADAVGAQAVVVPERGASGLTTTVAKASAGAIEYMPVVRVTNLAQAVQKAKEAGVFVFAADPQAQKLYTEVNWSGPVGVVIGAEGEGVRPLVKNRCDGVIKLPMLGHVSSLNASNAASVIGFEIIRQRHEKNSVLTRV